MATTKKKSVTASARSPAAKKTAMSASEKKFSGRASKKAPPAKPPSGKSAAGKTVGMKTAARAGTRAAGAIGQPRGPDEMANANATSPPRAKKPKLVRDSFTIPKAEYLVLQELKSRASKLTRPAKKSELLRAGVKALASLSDAAFLAALEKVPAIKTGRPALNP
jgi:hypothetical protein